MFENERDVWDAIVVGAGPAGLSAALYLARYRRHVLVIHDGKARALRIPLTHNAPGYPDGVRGNDLICDMLRHAETYGAAFCEQHVVSISPTAETFAVVTDNGDAYQSRSIILATGLQLNQIPLDAEAHEAAINAGVLRYCPVCDAYEHSNKNIAVVGCDLNGAAEALFLRQYSDDVTLVPAASAELSAEDIRLLDEAGVETLKRPVASYDPRSTEMGLRLVGEDTPRSFDVVYPALGTRPRTRLAAELGLKVDDSGKVNSSSIFETSVEGVWCIGDIVDGLDQISVAMGHGAIAATKAHNWLREKDGHVVEELAEFEPVTPAPVTPDR